MKILVTNILWDVDGTEGLDDGCPVVLPASVVIERPTEEMLAEARDGAYGDAISDYLSDTFDYCVKGFHAEIEVNTMREDGLRKQIEKEKDWDLQKYGVLDWHWYDEGLMWAIQDYESCIGFADFTEDDWAVCEENGMNREMVEDLCMEES